MRISLFCGVDAASAETAVDRARAAAADGFDAIWYAQGLSLDALTALAVVAHEVADIDLGTAVVPIQGRHPLPLALQALTVSGIAGPGRFSLGLGVTHAVVSEGCFGIPYHQAVPLCAEEMAALAGLLGPDRATQHEGALLTARGKLGVDAPSPSLVLAALGPKMLEIAGRYSDGTVTWMTGPATVERDVVPALAASAAAAGRTAPRVVVGLPVCVTDDVDGARQRLGAGMAGAAQMPSYRRMLAAEGVGEPVDIALVGSEDAVGRRIEALGRAGASELLANVQGEPDEQARTRRFLGSLAGR
jgi:F420-dependent oxidoreductase-like protein